MSTLYTIRKWGEKESEKQALVFTNAKDAPIKIATQYAIDWINFPKNDAGVIIEIVELNQLFYVEYHYAESEIMSEPISEIEARKILAEYMN